MTTNDRTVEDLLGLQEDVSDVVEAFTADLLDQGMGSGWRLEPSKQTTLATMWRLAHSGGMIGFNAPGYARFLQCRTVINAAVRRLLALDIDLPLTDIERERLRND